MSIDWRPSGPPQRTGRGSTVHTDIIAQLRTRPRVWAVVRRFPSNLRGTAEASAAKLKELGALSTTRVEGNEVEVWAMWPEAKQVNAARTQE